MSNFFQILVVLVAATAVQAGDEDEPKFTLAEMVDLMTPFGDDCEHKPEREHVEELLLNKVDAQYPTKCFRFCLMQQFDTFKEGSTQMDVKKVVSMLSVLHSGKEEQITQITENCNAENIDVLDSCEAAHAHSMCMLQNMKSQGFKIPELAAEE